MPNGFPAEPSKVIGIGRSYRYNWPNNEAPDPLPEPMVFLKPPSSLAVKGEPVLLPKGCTIAYEVEIAVVIGKEGRNIKTEDAMSHVAGYALALDMCAGNVQAAARKDGLPWAISKGLDSFTPIGRFIPKSEISDPYDVHLQLSVNNVGRQDGWTSDLIYTIPQLVAYVSGIFTLQPGDIILTGTPPGVSLVNVGDTISASMTLRDSTVVDELVVDIVQRQGGYEFQRHWLEYI